MLIDATCKYVAVHYNIIVETEKHTTYGWHVL